MPGSDEDVGADLGGTGPQRPGLPASKRNLAALARSGRLPRFHYNKKLGPAASPLQPGSRIFMADRRLLPASSSGPAMPPMLRQQQQGWRPEGWTAAGDQALQGDAPEKMGVVEALGRLSEAAIFPYIGPHRWIQPWCLPPPPPAHAAAHALCLPPHDHHHYPPPAPTLTPHAFILHPLPLFRARLR